MVNTSISLINEIPKINRNRLIRSQKKGRILGDILTNLPENTIAGRLSSAATEELNAAEPNAEDAVELSALASGGEFEDDGGIAGEGAVRRRGVRGGDRGVSVGVGEVMGEEEVRTRGSVREFYGFSDFEEFSGGVAEWW